jgi:lipopolysaccharide assembly outer membrane protein LptD (OstA)
MPLAAKFQTNCSLKVGRFPSLQGIEPAMLSRSAMRCLRCVPIVLAAALVLMRPTTVGAQGSQLEISMDELVEDKWNNLVIARGNVEVRFYGEILLADEVVYDRHARKLSARGNVTLQEADGKITRSERMTLHDDLRDAFLAYVRRQKVETGR